MWNRSLWHTSLLCNLYLGEVCWNEQFLAVHFPIYSFTSPKHPSAPGREITSEAQQTKPENKIWVEVMMQQYYSMGWSCAYRLTLWNVITLDDLHNFVTFSSCADWLMSPSWHRANTNINFTRGQPLQLFFLSNCTPSWSVGFWGISV